VEENNGLNCIESYDNINIDASIYREAMNDRLSKGKPSRPKIPKEVNNLT
jgi:hypothetical protein